MFRIRSRIRAKQTGLVFVSSGGGGFTISTAPTLAGSPVVGQRIFATNGTYSATPDSYAPVWTVGGVVVDSSINSLLILDSFAGLAIGYSEVATKASYTNTASNPAAPTAAVANISLTSAITSVTRTSASGVLPIAVDLALAANVYEGYFLDRIVYTDAALSVLKGTASHLLTNADLQPAATIDWTADGGPAIAASDWLQYRIRTTSPNGTGYGFTFATAITPTDAVVPMTWSTTDFRTGMTISNGNLTIASNVTWSAARTSRGIGAGKKVYVEMAGDCYPGVADASATLLDAHGAAPTLGDGAATIHASEYQPYNQTVFFNGTNVATPTAGNTSYVLGIALDTTGTNPVATFYYNNVLQGSRTLTGIGSPLFFMTTMPNGHSTTLNPGTTPGGTAGFTFTPPTGFVAP